MAIISSLAIGKARKCAGNLRFSTVQGRTIVAQKPNQVANPNTPAQQAQRGKMKEIVTLYTPFMPALTHAYAGRKRYTSVFNAFVSANVGIMSGTTDKTITQILAAKPAIQITNGALGNVVTTRQSTTVIKADISTCKNSLRVGDKLVVFSGTMTGDITTITQALTQADITAGTVSVNHSTGTAGFVCTYAYSAKGNKSSNGKLLYW